MPDSLLDTTPEAQAVLLDLLRNMPPAQKLRIIFGQQMTSRRLIVLGLRQRFPQADDAEIRRRTADMWLGKELAAEVYGPLPEGWAPTYKGTRSPIDEY